MTTTPPTYVQALGYRPALQLVPGTFRDRYVEDHGPTHLTVTAACPVCKHLGEGEVTDSHSAAGYAEVSCRQYTAAGVPCHGRYAVPMEALRAPEASRPALPQRATRTGIYRHDRPTDLRRKAKRVYIQGHPGGQPRI